MARHRREDAPLDPDWEAENTYSDGTEVTDIHPVRDVVEVDMPLVQPGDHIEIGTYKITVSPPPPEMGETSSGRGYESLMHPPITVPPDPPSLHERFQPMYAGGQNPHETAPIAKPIEFTEADRDRLRQEFAKSVAKHSPLAANLNPESPSRAATGRDSSKRSKRSPTRIAQDAADDIAPELERKHTGFFWALTGFLVMAAALALALWLVRVIDGPRLCHCPAPPTMTQLVPIPSGGGP